MCRCLNQGAKQKCLIAITAHLVDTNVKVKKYVGADVMENNDFEILLSNVIDVDIDVWQEDRQEPEQIPLFEDQE